MNFIKRAFITINRMYIKSIVLIFLLTTIGFLILSSISIQEAVSNTEYNLRKNMLPVVLIEMDWQEFDLIRTNNPQDERLYDKTSLSPSLIKQFGDLKYVDFYDYRLETSLMSNELLPWVPLSLNYHLMSTLTKTIDSSSHFVFNISGVSKEYFLEQRTGFIDLSLGRTFLYSELTGGENVAIVSHLLAVQNNLNIGDRITFSNKQMDWDFYLDEIVILYSRDYSFEIIGLFDVYGIENINFEQMDFTDLKIYDYVTFNRVNQIFIPNSVVSEINKQIVQVSDYFSGNTTEFFSYRSQPVFLLSDPLYVEKFSAAITPYLPSFYAPFTLINRFEPISSSMENLINIAEYILLVTIGTSIFLISLIITLSLIDRKKEFFIYSALGEKSGKIFGQTLFEIFIISIISLVVSIPLGKLFSKILSTNMIENQITQITNIERYFFTTTGRPYRFDSLEYLGFPPPMSVEEMLYFFDIDLTENIFIFSLIFILSIIVITIISFIIVFYNKSKIN